MSQAYYEFNSGEEADSFTKFAVAADGFGFERDGSIVKPPEGTSFAQDALYHLVEQWQFAVEEAGEVCENCGDARRNAARPGKRHHVYRALLSPERGHRRIVEYGP